MNDNFAFHLYIFGLFEAREVRTFYWGFSISFLLDTLGQNRRCSVSKRAQKSRAKYKRRKIFNQKDNKKKRQKVYQYLKDSFSKN